MFCWSFPCSSGDFRLTPKNDTVTLLEIEKPTAKDREVLGKLLTTCRAKEWIGGEVGLPDNRKGPGRKPKHVIEIAAPMNEVAAELSLQLHGDGSKTWTAIRFESGAVVVEDGVTPLKVEDGKSEDAPVAAATVREPQRGCPAPEPAERRASEVLRAFSDARQWVQWTTKGFMDVVGEATGKLYRLWHHNEAIDRGLGHLLVDLETGHEVCVYDPLIPAPEEALSIKLAVEHRESWLLDGAANYMGSGYGDDLGFARRFR